MTNPDPIGVARFRLAYELPFLAPLVYSLVPVKKPGLGTLAVDQYHRLYYDPEVEEKWNIEQLVGVLYHEINHLMRIHHDRGEGKDGFQWNLAADAEINDDIKKDGFTLPEGCIYPERIPGAKANDIAEHYYDLLEKQKQDAPGGKQGDGGGEGDPGNTPGPGNGKCGPAAGGDAEDWMDGPPQDGDPGLNPQESDLVMKETASEIDKAQKSQGRMPGHLSRWAEDKLKKKVDWRKSLSHLIKRAFAYESGVSDYTFKKPSRRSTDPVIMPATHSPKPNVATIIDTSGSMSTGELGAALTHVDGVLKQLGLREVHNFVVDDDVHYSKKITKASQIKLTGGGGTDMRKGIKAATDLRPKPDIVILFTDAETPWPETKPASHLVVCVINRYLRQHTLDSIPSYAKVVIVKDEDD